MLVATPGAGKTKAMLKATSEMLESKRVYQVVVVSPSKSLREQWIKEAEKIGIKLTDFEESQGGNINLTRDFIGLVTTYQQVAARKEHFLAFTSQQPTMVILDEIHHCGDQKSWGKAVEYSFSPTNTIIYRLSGSGTPFRSDSGFIPFVEYDSDFASMEDGTLEKVRFAKANHKYLYRDALIDGGIVRDVAFVTFGGSFSWRSTRTGQEEQATFEDEIDPSLHMERLRAAINPQEKWLREYIARANTQLEEIRNKNGHHNAGGLILAEDSDGAREIADRLQEITGEKPALVLYDIPESQDIIKTYKEGNSKWLVAVRMVSEGVDIPRMRVLLWGTPTRTKMFFQQAVGRVVRWQKDAPLIAPDGRPTTQTAVVYLPADPELLRYAEEMNQDIREWIRYMEGSSDSSEKVERQLTLEEAQNVFEGLASDELAEGDHILSSIDVHRMDQGLIQEALQAFASLPMFQHHLPTELAAAYSMIKGRQTRQPSEGQDKSAQDKTAAEIEKVVGSYATIVSERHSTNTPTEKKEREKTTRDLRKYLRSGCHKMTNRLIYEMAHRGIIPNSQGTVTLNTQGRVDPKSLSLLNSKIGYKLNRRQGVENVTKLLVEQLQERQKILAEWIDIVKSEGRDPGVF